MNQCQNALILVHRRHVETLPNVDQLEMAHHVHVCQTTLVVHQIVDQSVSLIQIVHLIDHVLLNVAAIHVKDHVVLIQVEFFKAK